MTTLIWINDQENVWTLAYLLGTFTYETEMVAVETLDTAIQLELPKERTLPVSAHVALSELEVCDKISNILHLTDLHEVCASLVIIFYLF